jgi:hypothetical protein
LSELSSATLESIKNIFSNASDKNDLELTIALCHTSNEYFAELDESILQMQKGKNVLFTMDELEDYLKSEAQK